MICERYREVLSAHLDGEATSVEAAAIEAHLAVCRSCRAFAGQLARVTRATRVTAAESVPDLTGPILATLDAQGERAVATGPTPPSPAPPSAGIARLGLALVALAQGALAVLGFGLLWLVAHPGAGGRRPLGRRPAPV